MMEKVSNSSETVLESLSLCPGTLNCTFYRQILKFSHFRLLKVHLDVQLTDAGPVIVVAFWFKAFFSLEENQYHIFKGLGEKKHFEVTLCLKLSQVTFVAI